MVKIVRTRKSSSAPRIKPPEHVPPTARRARAAQTSDTEDEVRKTNKEHKSQVENDDEENAIDLKCTETFDELHVLAPASGTDMNMNKSEESSSMEDCSEDSTTKRVLMTTMGMRVTVTNNLELAAREEQLQKHIAKAEVATPATADRNKRKTSSTSDNNGNNRKKEVQKEDKEKKLPSKRSRTDLKKMVDSPATRAKRASTETPVSASKRGKSSSVSCFGQPGVSSWAGQSSSRSNNWTPPTFRGGQGKSKSSSKATPLQVSQPLYSWGVLRLGKELGSVALNEYLGRSKSSSTDAGNSRMHRCDAPYSPEQTLQIIETLRPKTCVPPKDSFLHKVVLGRGQVGKAALTIKTLSDPDLQKALRSMYELMCKQDADDGASFRRETQYMSALSCTDKLVALENTAFRLKSREDEVMAKSEDMKKIMDSLNQSQNAASHQKQNRCSPAVERRHPMNDQSPGVIQLSRMFSPPPIRPGASSCNMINLKK